MPCGIYPRKPLRIRFWSKVKKTHSCWIWIGAKSNGKWKYGISYYNGKDILAHRLAWIMTYNDIPKGVQVLHKCDNPSCVNPKHLFLGTQRDNIRDCIKKGRFIRAHLPGELNPCSKLSNNEASEIRRELENYKYGMYSKLSREYGVDVVTIIKIGKNLTYQIS